MTYVQLVKNVFLKGHRINVHDQTTKELTNQTIEIKDHNFYSFYPGRTFDKIYFYLLGELIWYFSGQLKPTYVSNYSNFWLKLRDWKGSINSNYGHLVFYKDLRRTPWWRRCPLDSPKTPYEWCVNQLLHDETSRQAVILYNDRDYFQSGTKDFICTQLQHFLVRDEALDSIVYIRSSDLIYGLTYDIPWWSLVQQQLLHRLQSHGKSVRLGKLTVHIGSAHIYDSKFQLVNSMLISKIKPHMIKSRFEIPLRKDLDWYRENLRECLDVHPVEFNLNQRVYDTLY